MANTFISVPVSAINFIAAFLSTAGIVLNSLRAFSSSSVTQNSDFLHFYLPKCENLSWMLHKTIDLAFLINQNIRL